MARKTRLANGKKIYIERYNETRFSKMYGVYFNMKDKTNKIIYVPANRNVNILLAAIQFCEIRETNIRWCASFCVEHCTYAIKLSLLRIHEVFHNITLSNLHNHIF